MNEIPNEGGSYTRNEDGSLTRVADAEAPQQPSQDKEAAPSAEDAVPVASSKKGK